MRDIIKKIGIFFTVAISFLCTSYTNVSAAETLSSSSNDNEIKILIGIAILCVVTFFVILRRAIYAKKNN